ncbi:MAG TPA: dihydrofolate reductase family protein [Bacteroidales bacterium]
MREIVLFSASSLDGYIARKNGDIDWLFTDGDYGYLDFYNSIDTTLTGHNTYKQVLTFGEFPYPGKTNYIFGKPDNPHDKNPVIFVSDDMITFVRQLKHERGKKIWLVGGGQLNTTLWNAGLIDEIILSVHPVILGEGIPLLSGNPVERKLKLIRTKSFESGLVQITYST